MNTPSTNPPIKTEGRGWQYFPEENELRLLFEVEKDDGIGMLIRITNVSSEAFGGIPVGELDRLVEIGEKEGPKGFGEELRQECGDAKIVGITWKEYQERGYNDSK